MEAMDSDDRQSALAQNVEIANKIDKAKKEIEQGYIIYIYIYIYL